MNKKQFQKQLEERNQEHQLESLEANRNRAQSVSVGTSASGTTELTMRSVNGSFLWNIYQPVQVVELIHQLAASIGCHIHIQPRDDFSSYREWNEPTEEEREHLNGHPPFANRKLEYSRVGITSQKSRMPGFTSDIQQQLKEQPKEQQHVATEKTVNGRSSK
tara:strand:- start:11116 stop:11601 length:486 start_codon:yes stop_codon:yes gene_type:complete